MAPNAKPALLLALALGLAAGPAAPAAAQDGKPPAAGDPLPNDPQADLAVRVGQAIDSGVAWLKGQASVAGTYGEIQGDVNYLGGKDLYLYPAGLTALSLYTLLKCGVPADDPVVARGFDWLRTRQEVPASSYEISVLILALEAKSNRFKREKDREKDARNRARKGQKTDSLVRLPPADAAWMKKLLAQLLRRRRGSAGWRYNCAYPSETGEPVSVAPSDVDMSSTQLAMLALAAGERCGIAQPDDVYLTLLEWTLDQQEKEGPPLARFEPGSGKAPAPGESTSAAQMDRCRGWAYIHDSPNAKESAVTGCMTSCGLADIVICSSLLQQRRNAEYGKRLAARAEKAWWDGIAWTRAHWGPGNPAQGYSAEYYLYCVERVGDLRGIHLIGEHDWYTEGARHLVGSQLRGGRWHSSGGHEPRNLIGSCFALLFLERATPTVATGD